MPKVGFNNQWIEIARLGQATDSTGTARDLSPEWIKRVIANYKAGGHDAPVVVGHPDSDTEPAFGWTSDLRLNGDVLEARFVDTDDEFEKLVEAGRYKKRSASFYLDPPSLRHVGFLGGAAPAIKGLADIKFSDGDSFAVEVINLTEEKKMEEEDLDQLPESFWEKVKAKLGGQKAEFKEGDAKTPPAADQTAPPASEQTAVMSLSEEQISAMVKSAVAATTAEYKAKFDALAVVNAELVKKIDAGVATGRRSQIVSFVELIPVEKARHYLKSAGVVDFMESLADADERDGGKAAIKFAERKAGEKPIEFSRVEWFKQFVTELPAIVEFGERFGQLEASPEAGALVNTDRINAMKAAAGVKTAAVEIAGGAK